MCAPPCHAVPVRAARPFSRRASVVVLGGGALISVALPTATRAGKAGKKARKKCKRQIGICQGSVTTLCAGPLTIEQETCEAAFLPCCASFKGCKAGGHLRLHRRCPLGPISARIPDVMSVATSAHASVSACAQPNDEWFATRRDRPRTEVARSMEIGSTPGLCACGRVCHAGRRSRLCREPLLHCS